MIVVHRGKKQTCRRGKDREEEVATRMLAYHEESGAHQRGSPWRRVRDVQRLYLPLAVAKCIGTTTTQHLRGPLTAFFLVAYPTVATVGRQTKRKRALPSLRVGVRAVQGRAVMNSNLRALDKSKQPGLKPSSKQNQHTSYSLFQREFI